MIAVFSGTGNSMHVARLLQERLGDEIVELPCDVDTPADGRLIWVFPIYSWGLPPVVKKCMANAAPGGGLPAFMVATCGDDIGRADRHWAKQAEARGYCAMGAFSVQMPNTYVLMKGFDVDPLELAKQKIKDSTPRVQIIADAIRTACDTGIPAPNDVVPGSFAAIKSGIIYPWFKRFAMSPDPFFADSHCCGCGVCARNCPLENITMTESHPEWGKNCTLCLRCYHICPTHAVCYTTATRGKGQFRLMLSELNSKSDRGQ